jgi:excalibur calcium-binding domain-containing protein
MTKAKKQNNSRIKSKTVEVKSKALFGKSEMDKAIEKYTKDGWTLASQEKINESNRYLLHFEKEQQVGGCKRLIRITGLATLFCFISTFGLGMWLNYDEAIYGPTRTIEAQTQSVFDTQTAVVDSTQNAPTYDAQTATARVWTKTPTPPPSNTPRPTTRSIDIFDYPNNSIADFYALSEGVRGRSCPQLSCDVVVVLSFREGIRIVGSTEDGDSIGGDTQWFVANNSGQRSFIHSSLLSRTRPADPAAQSSGSSNTRRPANCSEARAMGLTAQQAAQWSHLDRDKDGVACYGD